MLILILFFWIIPFVLSLILGWMNFKGSVLSVRNIVKFVCICAIPILSVVLAGVMFIDLIDKLEMMNKSVKL
jgi:hypothetical protein